MSRDAALDQTGSYYVVFSRVLITLEHYSRGHNLKQIFAKARLWFGRREVTLAIARIRMFALACLHVVNYDYCDIELCRYFLEAD